MCHFPAIIVNFLWNQRKAQTFNYIAYNASGLKIKLSNMMFFKHKVAITSMIHGSLVTTTWHSLRLQMKEKASRYGG